MVPQISDSEWEVMKVLWEKSPLTAQEVIAAVAKDKDWSPKTVKTLLGRLVKKKALGFEADGRTYRYHAAVGRAECARSEGRSFLERVYDGALTPMIAEFIRQEKLSPDEIRELKRLLDGKGGGRGNRP